MLSINSPYVRIKISTSTVESLLTIYRKVPAINEISNPNKASNFLKPKSERGYL